MKKNIFLILILSLLLCACEGEVNQPIEEQPVLYYKTIKVVVVSNKKNDLVCWHTLVQTKDKSEIKRIQHSKRVLFN